MNKTGIAWGNRIGNNWIYQRQVNTKSIRIKDPDIRNLHKKVIANNYVWGIRNLELAKQVIENIHITSKPTKPQKEGINVTLKRTDKTKFQASIKGLIKPENVRKILNDLKFFEFDMEQMQTNNINGKTEILLIYNLDISLIPSFENTVKKLGWDMQRV